MYSFFLDFREILGGNRDVLFTYYPESSTLFKGKRPMPNTKMFWFDKESHENGSKAFAEVFAQTNKLADLAEELGVDAYAAAKSKISTYCKVYSKIQKESLFYDLIPEDLVRQYGDALFQISKGVFERQKPGNYSFLLDERGLIEDIWFRELQVSDPKLDKKILPRVMYDPWRGVTGRLNHAPRSFPILSLPKERRVNLRPSNDIFVEYDMKSADFRTFLYLFADNPEKWHDQEDLYADIPGDDRAAKKQKVFQTIYSSQENAFLKRHNVFKKALDMIVREDDFDVFVRNPFGREIRVSKSKGSLEHLIVSYLIQSTTNDVAIQQAVKIREMLVGTKSHVAFLIHDCFVVDFAAEDYERLGLDIRNDIRYSREVGRFFWRESYGPDFGNL